MPILPNMRGLSAEGRSRFQTAYKGLRDLIRRQENPSASTTGPLPSAPQASMSQPAPIQSADAVALPEHDPQAEQDMDEAETFFYEGKYANAIKYYDQVLKIEPKWERARQHRREAEEYLRTGHIPSVALPPEAASAFGKAQSAARLGRYSDALLILHKAQSSLRDMGIQRWQDGQEFEQKLQQYIDAESVYLEGVQSFSQGMIDDGIEKVDAASQTTGLPRYMNRSQEYHNAKATMQTIAEGLNNSNIDTKTLAQVRKNLDMLNLQFGDNPGFLKLKERYQILVPAVMESLKGQITSLQNQAAQAQVIEAALTKTNQARDLLEQVKELGYPDPTVQELQTENEKLLHQLQVLDDEMRQALALFQSHRSWPAAAVQISKNVRTRFPNDPRVAEFNQSLNPYRNLRTGLRVLIILLAFAAAGGLALLGYNMRQNYLISLIPTPTATATATSTPLPTATSTPLPTATPTITPTPLMGVITRDVWVRNGCYETFGAVGRVEADSTVRFLPAERRFDNLNRECVLVEYSAPDNTSVIGWVLIADLKN